IYADSHSDGLANCNGLANRDGDADPNRISNGDALFVAQSDASDIRHRYTCIDGERYSDADGDAFRDSYTHSGGDPYTYSGGNPHSGAERLRLLPSAFAVPYSGHAHGSTRRARRKGPAERRNHRGRDGCGRRTLAGVRRHRRRPQRDGNRAQRGELSDRLSDGCAAAASVEPQFWGRANGAEPRNGEGWPGREGERVQRRRSGACDFRRRGLFRVDDRSRKSNEKQIVNL